MSGLDIVTAAQRGVRVGPNAAVKSAPGWRWYEVIWCVAAVGWFGTTGRLVDVVVAVGLILFWVVGPAVGIIVVGNFAILALEIHPTALLPLAATELILGTPLLIESKLAAATTKIWALHSGILAVSVGAAVVGIWREWSVLQLALLLGGLYVIGLGSLRAGAEMYESVGHTDADPDPVENPDAERDSSESPAEVTG